MVAYGCLWLRCPPANKKTEISTPWFHTTMVCGRHGEDKSVWKHRHLIYSSETVRIGKKVLPQANKKRIYCPLGWSQGWNFIWRASWDWGLNKPLLSGQLYWGWCLQTGIMIGRMAVWEISISKIRGTVVKYSEERYSSITCDIQPELIFLQRGAQDI